MIMKDSSKSVLKEVIRFVVTVLSALAATLGVESCSMLF